ncbi:anaerobic C4-dicarboxylate transporter family protein [Candidatus Cardinium hertigii]|uniref:Uncharacterized protein n=1 Tax=Candidatus Cardinium hertigii TaxID=247481 RepID=A0A2Z3L904_9BACT|nr:anaerobic C4-dicarboxylate transporter family protein [Candidatus Cardinium hertigii]AWN81871.1 hypothetical protein DK880_00553 [Candidatus Cardinium hertigii]
MVIIGWGILLCILLASLYLEGIAVGLLSGLSITLLSFSGYLSPAQPPYTFIFLQAAWIILTATLETAGFFHFLETKFKQTLSLPQPLLWVVCFSLIFITGNLRFIYAIIHNQRYNFFKQLLFTGGRIAYIFSPLSLPGMLLYLVLHTHALSLIDLLYILGVLSIYYLPAIPYSWPIKRYKTCPSNAAATAQAHEVQRAPYIYLLLLLLLCLMEGLLLGTKPTPNGFTACSFIGKVFKLKIAYFYPLIMLSTAAIVALCLTIKPAQILLTDRFKGGIKQFFIFLGLIWLLDSLLYHDKEILLHIGQSFFLGIKEGTPYVYIGYLLSLAVAWLYLLLLDIEIIIWFFIPLCIASLKGIAMHRVAPWSWILLLLSLGSICLVRYWIHCFSRRYTVNCAQKSH